MKKTYLFILSLSMFLALFGQSYELGHTTITFNDVNRSGGLGSGSGPGRQIQTEIYYPANVAGNDVALSAGSFPVTVFGHVFAMAWSAYENIWEEFAWIPPASNHQPIYDNLQSPAKHSYLLLMVRIATLPTPASIATLVS